VITNGGTKGTSGTTASNERERHFDPNDLDFKNAFNSAGQFCLWVILRDLGVPDVDFLQKLKIYTATRG